MFHKLTLTFLTKYLTLQASPWNSPRIMSPVDARHILGSRSTENLRLCDNYALESNFGTPLRRKSSNRSLRRKSPQPGEHRLSVSQSNQDMEEFDKINQPSLLNRYTNIFFKCFYMKFIVLNYILLFLGQWKLMKQKIY